MIQTRSMGMGCRALVTVFGLAATLAGPANAANPLDLLGSLGGNLGGLLGGQQAGSQGGQQGGGQQGGGQQGGGQQGGGHQGGGKKPLTMMLPSQGLGTMQSLNRSVNINRVGISQAAYGGSAMQTVIATVDQKNGSAPKSLLVPYNQLGPIKQWNRDLNFNVINISNTAYYGDATQVAIVGVTQSNSNPYEDDGYADPFGGQQGGGQQGGGQQGGGQQGGGQQGGGQQGGGQQQGGKKWHMVAPAGDVPFLKAANSSTNINVINLTNVALGGDANQTAIIGVDQSNGGSSGGYGGGLGTPMFVPASQVGAYKALNLHLNINVITMVNIAIGGNATQVALINVNQGNS